jgi:DNA-binding response OmpR family regulator
MRGGAVAGAVRSEIFVLMLTAKSSEEERAAFALGADDYIVNLQLERTCCA